MPATRRFGNLWTTDTGRVPGLGEPTTIRSPPAHRRRWLTGRARSLASDLIIVEHSSERTGTNVVRRLAATLCKGGGMPRMVITHDVADVDTWLKFKSERADAISGMGGSHVVDHVAHDGTNRVAVAAETDDVEAILAAIASPPPELLSAMDKHGVIPPLTVFVER
jgi:hypothetical protein